PPPGLQDVRRRRALVDRYSSRSRPYPLALGPRDSSIRQVMNFRRPATLIRTIPPFRWGARLLMRTIAPRQWVGAVGAVFNQDGQVLLLEHAFRTDYPWGLP